MLTSPYITPRGLLGPFLATLIPTRLVVNWSRSESMRSLSGFSRDDLDPAVETFAHELTSHLGSKADDLARTLGGGSRKISGLYSIVERH